MRKLLTVSIVMLALAACGSKKALVRPAGDPVPATPVVDRVAPTSDQMITPDAQSRPERSDEILRRSEKRREDKFDLPPTL